MRLRQDKNENEVYVPIDIATILPSRRKFRFKLDAGKHASLSLHGAYESDGTDHVTRDLDRVADGQVLGDEPSRSKGRHD